VKIGLYISDILFRTGGTEANTAYIIHALQRSLNNPNITVISEKYTKKADANDINIVDRLNSLFGTSITDINIHLFLLYSNKKNFLQRAFFEKKLYNESKKFNLFINCSMSLFIFNAQKNIMIVHFPPYHKTDSGFVKRFPPAYFFAVKKDRSFLTKYDLYISYSQYVRNWLNKIWKINDDRSITINPAVSLVTVCQTPKIDSIIICSRIEPSKDIDILISAFLSSEYLKNNMSLFILGSVITENTVYSKKIKSMISICKNISFMENPDRKTIEDYYGRSKIFWHAKGFSTDEDKNPYALEHFGLTTVEAMSAGCVPIVINKGGQKEIVENGINGFLWNNPEQLIEKTVFLIQNSAQYASMSKAAKESVKRYSLDGFTNNFDKILKSKL
jgi:glycosyltransferase involved in cell wall biosynthesis